MKKINTEWSANLAYAVGLIATDGSLSKDGRHISFTSKDFELVNNLQRSLGISCHVGKKSSGSNKVKKYYVVQPGDVAFYGFLLSLGLMPNKTKILNEIFIPQKYFFDFLRGHFDGDGSFYSYFDPRWKSSYMFYTSFVSASKDHIQWLQKTIFSKLKIKGHITKSINSSVYQLKYAKAETLQLVPKLYYNDQVICLTRKRLKIEKALSVLGNK